MNSVDRILHTADRIQQGRPRLAFTVAVWKKFSEDQAGELAALVAYYGFAALFPLLLVLVTVLDLVLAHDPALRATVLDSAFGQFPVVGTQLRNNVHSLHETGTALVIGLLLMFLGARGVANAMQNALNSVWAVPYARRPAFPASLLRSAAMLLVVGLGLIATSALSGLAASATAILPGASGRVIAIAVSLLLNIVVLWAGFRLATAREITSRKLLPGAVLAAIAWEVLQLLGGYIVGHQLSRSSSLYGVFAIVLGLLAWLYLQAQVTLLAAEVSVVHARRLWPRSLAPPPFTAQDLRAMELQARAQQRLPQEQISVRVKDHDG